MRLTRTILGFAVAACFTLAPAAYADHGRGSAPKPTTGAGKPNTTANQTTTSSGPQTTTSKPGGKSTPHSSSSKSSTKSASKSTTTSGTGGTSGTSTHLNPIAAKISSKPQLNAKISGMLPVGANGKQMSLNEASKGFKNQGQFIAALHASQNHGIAFADLKNDMVKKHMSLGQSIQDLKHSSSSTASSEAHEAEHEADDDIKSTTSTPHHDGDHDGSKHGEKHEDATHHQSVAHQISSNKQLLAKVQPLLPPGMTLADAAKGFRSESQFLAALHASKDLGIPFAQIKGEMTGNDHDSLTRAIQELKPGVDAAAAARTAQQEASADIKTTAPTHTDHDGDDQ